MGYKISSIFINKGQKVSNAGEVFISQVDEHKESLAGRLFILIEVDSLKGKTLKIVNFLVNNINYNYYQNEKILLREKIKSITIEHIFETTLSSVNKDLINFLNQEKIKISPYSINATVGVIHEEHLYFSSIGKNKNLLIYPQKTNQGYAINDIGESKKKRVQTTSLFKLFSDVMSGPIPSDGYYFLLNETLDEYLSEKQINNIITKLPPASAATQIENIINQINVNALFLGLIIKNTSGVEVTAESEELKPREEMIDLNQTRRRTDDIMRPAGIINLRKAKDAGKNILEKIFKKKESKPIPYSNYTQNQESKLMSSIKPPVGGQLQLKEKLFFEKKSPLLSFKKIINFTKNLFLGIVHLVALIFIFFSKPNNIKNLFLKVKLIPRYIKIYFFKIINNIWELNIKNKITLLIGIGFVLAFIISTSFYINNNKNEEKIAQIDNIIQDIERNQNKIEASLLYNNEKDAQDLVKQNKLLINNLSTQLEESEINQAEKYQELLEKQEKQSREIMHIVPLGDKIVKIEDLSQVNSQVEALNMVFYENSLFIGDNKNSNVYKKNLEENTIVSLGGENLKSLSLPALNKSQINYFDYPEATILNLETEEFNNIKIDVPENLNIGNMAGFAGRIYMLDNESDQIYRYDNPANMQNKQTWLNEEVDLQNSVDIAIDGHIYVLKQSGVVEKYLKGAKEDFELSSPFPEIIKAKKIQISPEMDKGFIYILEPDQKRLLKFDKTGSFLEQYQYTEFKNLKNFFVDEDKNIIYFLDDNLIYEYPI
ncbi:hypothetical protein K8R62_02135 [bacterium]|nr:hypothetical protein [bacterium]